MHHYHFIRLFRAGKQPSQDPMLEEAPTPDGGTPNSTVQGWSEPCPDVLHGRCRVDFSAMCYLYGRNLFELTGRKVPIGLIGSYVGGTADELWR